MSDIQDLIHKITMDSIERGKVVERERIIKLLDEHEWGDGDYVWKPELIELINGENNGN